MGRGQVVAGHPPAGDAAPEALNVCQGQVQLEEPRGHLQAHLGAQLLRQHPCLLGHLLRTVDSGCQRQGDPGTCPAWQLFPAPPPHQTLQLPEGEGEEVDLHNAAGTNSTHLLTPPVTWRHHRRVRAGTAASALGPTCGRGWRRCHSRPAGPRRRRQPAPPGRRGAGAPAVRKARVTLTFRSTATCDPLLPLQPCPP